MPHATVGVLGGGQLAQMLAQAASPLDIRVRSLDTSGDAPAASVCQLITGRFDDPDAIRQLASGCDVVTCEFENVPASVLEAAAKHAPVHPLPRAFAVAQDRLLERQLFASLGIQTPRSAPIDTIDQVASAIQAVGLPAILKTRRMGYDGKGQRVVRTLQEAHAAAASLLGAHDSGPTFRPDTQSSGGVGGSGGGGGGLIADEMVALDREVSIIAVRANDGEIRTYPVTENIHERGILRRSIAPAPSIPEGSLLHAQAIEAVRSIATSLGYVGVLAVEFFLTSDPSGQPRLLANEMAPRVHNTGHWTIEGAHTSQFENHLRAILGLPLGATDMATGSAGMVNLVGTIPPLAQLLAVPGAHLHLYAKAPRPGRKVGHVTLCDPDPDHLTRRVTELEAIVPWML
ncbi:5-(carboxyamino)imidazole ribonucleotide synthase [Nodularia spumigena]|uniref:5-(carboxyamino)imidazole ribonucleotide synthase n=1 Tax=Nodularia spumigena TaxID=70799 RepID=UPI002B203A58|nr:5-(carboxyamino)imidazole ribonucleotide synthase [Nodularia spumigena]MEA5557679.1 5-(carboxyamino)imidazole ribonucleotide synthase [Nodularia spumigena CH309]